MDRDHLQKRTHMTEKKRKLKYVTLIWEELPESIKVFVIPTSDIEKPDVKMLRACHRNYVNAAGKYTELVKAELIDAALIRLYNLLTDPDADWITDGYRKEQAEQLDMSKAEFDELLGRWFQYRVESDKPMTLPRSKLYRSGFLL